MSDLQLVLWVLGFCFLIGILFGPGMWSENWGWGALDRIFKKKDASAKDAPTAGPDDTGPHPR